MNNPLNNNDKPNFLDRGTLTAFALILLFWFGWSKYMESPQSGQQPSPPVSQPGTTAVPSQPDSASGNTGSIAAGNGVASTAVGTSVEPSKKNEPVAEKTLKYEDENFSFVLSSRGMGVHQVDVKKYKTREELPIILGKLKSEYSFSTGFVDSSEAINFQSIEKVGADTFVGRASVGGIQVEKTVKVNSAKYLLETQVKVTGNLEGFKGLTTALVDEAIPETTGGSFLTAGAGEFQEWFLLHDGKKTRQIILVKDGVQLTEANTSIAALGAHYFTLAIADRSDVLPRFASSVAPGSGAVVGKLSYQPMARADSFAIKYAAYAGPKSFEILSAADDNLNQVIDYGFFGALGKPILWLLKYLQSFLGNWGFSIIILTIIVRLIVLPFNAYAFKSMKAMQKIQPEMNRIKEKYKDKPTEAKLQMNQEIMQLMKSNNASPVGGCLPTLLQLPVFLALYQVLGQSIELYKVPFIFWINDLSSKDPFYVLPVLMGITMYLQQKITPTAMDPQQAKVLQWMPVIFSVFMLSLPSGLTLYIFVSTLFGILQQYYFMREKSTATGRVKEAKA